MHSGQCQCGIIKFKLSLPLELHAYHPRACDCDFCTQRQVQYLSDPDGTLIIPLSSLKSMQQQGDRQAEFITCNNCDDIIAASYKTADGIIGAVNAQLLIEKSQLGEPQTASPKLLSAKEKVARWHELWLTVIAK